VAVTRLPTRLPSRAEAQEPEEETSEQCANDADDEVADQSETAAAHDLAGQPTGHDADDQEPNDTHMALPFTT